MKTRPSREQFAAAYRNLHFTVDDIAVRFGISRSTVKEWARRFHLPLRQDTPAASARPRVLMNPEENHCEEMTDGPDEDDPTPEQIQQMASVLRAAHMMQKLREPNDGGS